MAREKSMLDVAIVGAGPAGLAASLVLKSDGLSACIFEAAAVGGGQLHLADAPIVDFLGQSRMNGPQLAHAFMSQATDAGIDIRFGSMVTSVHADDGVFVVKHGRSRVARARAVLIATGATPHTTGATGETREHVEGRARPQAAQLKGRRVVVVGGGDEACSTAWALAEHGARVVLAVRRKTLSARSHFRDRVVSHARIAVEANAIVERFEPGAVVLVGGKVLLADRIFVRIGAIATWPSLIPRPRIARAGFLRTDDLGRTSVPGLFAAGDVGVEPARRYVSVASGLGVAAARGIGSFVRNEAR